MSDERNPYLPAPPPDGHHRFGNSPADLGGNHRCELCGAYQGSTEEERTCRGEYAESGKMRAWARERWIADRLVREGTPRHIVLLTTREIVGVRRPGVVFSGETTYHLLLECGHEREVDYDDHRAVADHHVTEAACIAEWCPMKARDESDALNGRTVLSSEDQRP